MWLGTQFGGKGRVRQAGKRQEQREGKPAAARQQRPQAILCQTTQGGRMCYRVEGSAGKSIGSFCMCMQRGLVSFENCCAMVVYERG